MPYLRGSLSRKSTQAKPQSLKNEIQILKRRVASVTPRRVYFRAPKSVLGAGSPGYLYREWSITNDFIANDNFRDDINGDRWRNHWVKLMYTSETSAVVQLRFIVYSPKKAGAAFVPPLTSEGFTTPLDPSAFTVYYDDYIQNYNSIHPHYVKRMVKLGFNTLYNGSSDPGVLEKGDVRILVFFDNDTNLNGGQMYTQLCVSDN